MPQPPRTGPATAETLIGLGVLALAGLVLWQSAAIPTAAIYAKVGPRIFPYLAGGALAVIGAILAIQGLRGGWQPAEEREVRVDWRALAHVVAGLLANVVLIVPAGFTVASVVMFVLVARGFGSARPGRDAAMALVFALVAYFGFARALGVNIGAGPPERLLMQMFGMG